MSRSQTLLTNNTDPIFTRPEILLEPQLVKPLHGLNPRTILGKKWWDEQRFLAYAKNNQCCWACGTHRSLIKDTMTRLEAHESYKVDVYKCSYYLQEIVALCPKCHSYIHFGRTQILHERGQISNNLFLIIADHGDNILSKAGLNAKDAWWYDQDIIDRMLPEQYGTWNKWHIIINDKIYKSKFKDFEEWQTFYSGGKLSTFSSRIREDPSTGCRLGRSYTGSRSHRKR